MTHAPTTRRRSATEHRRRTAARLATTALVAGLVTATVPSIVAADGPTIVDCTAGDDLQSALDASDPGDIIPVQGTCVGTFVITSPSVTLSGTPQATLDGGGQGPVLTVAGGSTAVVERLTVTGGDNTAGQAAGGIRNDGDLTLRFVTVTGNRAVADPSAVADVIGATGGVVNNAVLRIETSSVIGNESIVTGVTVGDPTVGFAGGGVTNGGELHIVKSDVTDNTVTIAAAPDSGFEPGGAGGVATFGPLTVEKSVIAGNTLTADGSEGFAAGGVGGFFASIAVTDSEIVDNSVSTTASATPDVFGGVGNLYGPVAIVESSIDRNSATADGEVPIVVGGVFGTSGGEVSIEKSTIDDNTVVAPQSGAVGGLLAEALTNDPVAVSLEKTSISNNTVAAGPFGFGGALLVSTDTTATKLTVASNDVDAAVFATAGIAFLEADGSTEGGSAVVTSSRIEANTADAGLAVGGIFKGAITPVLLDDVIVQANEPIDCLPESVCG